MPGITSLKTAGPGGDSVNDGSRGNSCSEGESRCTDVDTTPRNTLADRGTPGARLSKQLEALEAAKGKRLHSMSVWLNAHFLPQRERKQGQGGHTEGSLESVLYRAVQFVGSSRHHVRDIWCTVRLTLLHLGSSRCPWCFPYAIALLKNSSSSHISNRFS